MIRRKYRVPQGASPRDTHFSAEHAALIHVTATTNSEEHTVYLRNQKLLRNHISETVTTSSPSECASSPHDLIFGDLHILILHSSICLHKNKINGQSFCEIRSKMNFFKVTILIRISSVPTY